MKLTDLTDLMNNVIESLKDRWDFYRHSAYLKKMGWTEEAYQRQTDPDHNSRADRIKDFYHGYPCIVVFTSSRGDPWTRFGTWLEGLSGIKDWCEENCQGKWRDDILRAHQQTGLKQVGDSMEWIEEPEWFVNEIGGGDVLFFAFKNKEDAFMFKLKWGGE